MVIQKGVFFIDSRGKTGNVLKLGVILDVGDMELGVTDKGSVGCRLGPFFLEGGVFRVISRGGLGLI